MKTNPVLPLLLTLSLVAGGWNIRAEEKPPASPPPTIWRLENPKSIGGSETTMTGTPGVVPGASGDVLSFDGADDGVVVPVNPLAGLKEFTVEALFCPAADGQPEQRFLHFQDTAGSRGLLEIRQIPDGQWALDTHLRFGEKGLTLLDRTKLHPAGKWTWVALRFDGKRMTHFVNGAKEGEGEIVFPPMLPGQVSLGMRLNKVSWFKGTIREVRFHPRALEENLLQRAP